MAFTLQPAVKDDFIDREDILADMLSTLKDKSTRMGFALVGSRRIGKTSILKEVVRRLEGEKDIVPVYFSIWDLVENTLPELCTRITLAIIEGFKPHLSLKLKMKQLLNVPVLKFFEVLRSLNMKIAFFDEIEIALRMGKSGEIDHNTLIEKMFLFGEKMAKENGVRLVLVLDESPSIMDVKNKTIWGMHFAPVCTTSSRSMEILARSNVTNCFEDEKSLCLTKRIPIISCNMLIFKYFDGQRKFVFNHKV